MNNTETNTKAPDGALTEEEMGMCIKLLHAVVKDILPQLGNIVLQDYAALNTGMLLAEKYARYEKRKS